MGKFRSLRRKVTGNALVDPALDLGGQIKDFDSHGGVLFKSGGKRPIGRQTHGTPDTGDLSDIAHLADRFQYLSVNVS
jgi:hypothetical protein